MQIRFAVKEVAENEDVAAELCCPHCGANIETLDVSVRHIPHDNIVTTLAFRCLGKTEHRFVYRFTSWITHTYVALDNHST